jgi:hypothetical protein
MPEQKDAKICANSVLSHSTWNVLNSCQASAQFSLHIPFISYYANTYMTNLLLPSTLKAIATVRKKRVAVQDLHTTAALT